MSCALPSTQGFAPLKPADIAAMVNHRDEVGLMASSFFVMRIGRRARDQEVFTAPIVLISVRGAIRPLDGARCVSYIL